MHLQLDEELRVSVGLEDGSFGFELFAHALEIVELASHDGPDFVIFVREGLLTRSEIDD